MSKIRTTMAVILAFIFWYMLKEHLQDVAQSLGVVAYEQYDAPRTISYAAGKAEIDVNGDYTTFGYILYIFCITISVWVGHVIHNASFKEAFTQSEKATFLAWFYACLVLIILTGMSALAFKGFEGFWANLIHGSIDLGAIIGVGRISYLWYMSKQSA